MNILIIDDLFLPEGAKNPGEKALLRLFAENRERRLALARELRSLGENPLLISAEPFPGECSGAFRFSEEDGICRLFVPVSSGRRKKFIPFRELFGFGNAVGQNSAAISGLFCPDAVISAGVFPFGAFASQKIAEESNSVLITELSAAPAELLSKNGLLSPLNPVLKVFRRAEETALSQSAAVLTLYPRAAEHLRPAKNIRPFFVPAPPEDRESGIPVLGFPEEKGFVLACAGYSASGFCEKELMDICKSFGKDFSLIFVSEEHPPKELLRHASEKGLRNVFFPEPFPKGKIPSVLGRADAVFVPEDEHLSGFGTEQEKFFSAFLSKRPVIAAAEHNTNFLRESGGTIIIKPKSRESIRLGIGAALKLSSGDRNTLGLLNRKFAEKNSPEKFAREYLSVIYECKNQKERTK